MRNLFFKNLMLIITPGLFIFLPFIVYAGESGNFISAIDTSFILKMLPAWISLAGAAVMLTLALKYMTGGSLAKPFILIGWGVLIDGLIRILDSLVFIRLLPESYLYTQVIFTGSLVFRLFVVFGVIWIASIFGILKTDK